MPDVRANIIISAKDETKGAVAGVGKGLGDMNKSLADAVKQATGLDLASLSLAGAVAGVGAALKASIDFTTQWADSVEDVSRVTGQSAEESSKLLTVLGDFGLKADTVRRAAKSLKDEGLTPSLDTLKELAKQYQAIQDPAERTAWGTKTLGKAYFDLAEILSKTPQEFDELSAAAERSGKIIGQDGVESAQKLKLQMAQLSDQMDGLKIAVGAPLVDTLSKAFDSFSMLGKIIELNTIKYQENMGAIDHTTAVMRAAQVAGADLQATAESLGGSYGPLDESTRAAARAQDDLAVKTRDEAAAMDLAAAKADALKAGLSGAIGKSQTEYKQTLGETNAELADVQAQLDKYTRMQGQNVTITNEATVSQAEYQLAQIGLAEAQKKLSETSADNTKEYLQAQVAVEGASQRVAEYATQLGGSETVTLSYTTKIGELSAKKAELQGKIDAARASLELETAQFLYQQLAVEGNTEANLKLARQLGILDEKSYAASMQAAALKKQFDDGKLSAEEYARKAQELADKINNIQSRTVTVTVVTQGDTGQKFAGGGGSGAQSETRRAAGGGFGPGYVLVGEQGPELVKFNWPGTVTPATQMQSGGLDPDVVALIRGMPRAMGRAVRDALAGA